MKFASKIAWLSLGSVLLCQAAFANGRFPAANQVTFSPTQPGHLLVRTTFGVFQSRDGGETADFLCEAVLGLSGVEDPMLALTGEGALVASAASTIWRSEDGCSFEQVSEPSERFIADLTVDQSEPERLLALSVEPLMGRSFDSHLLISENGGRTFESLEPALRPEILPLTLEVASSNSFRVYVTALTDKSRDYESLLLSSSNGGRDFVESEVPETSGQRLAFIAGVHPLREDRVYLRVDDPEGTRLWISDDAGANWREFFRGTGRLLGFAITEDGTEIYFGGPSDGLWAAESDGSLAERRSDLGPTCLGYGDFALYACSDRNEPYALARSTDGGRTFSRSLRFVDQCGGSSCEKGSDVQSTCPAYVSELAQTLGASCSPARPDPAPGAAGSSAVQTSVISASGGCQLGVSGGSQLSSLLGCVVGLMVWGRGRLGRRRLNRSSTEGS